MTDKTIRDMTEMRDLIDDRADELALILNKGDKDAPYSVTTGTAADINAFAINYNNKRQKLTMNPLEATIEFSRDDHGTMQAEAVFRDSRGKPTGVTFNFREPGEDFQALLDLVETEFGASKEPSLSKIFDAMPPRRLADMPKPAPQQPAAKKPTGYGDFVNKRV